MTETAEPQAAELPETVVPIQDGAKPQPAANDDAQPEAGAGDPASRIAALETEVASLKDQALRALAEAENTRRRAVKEREDAGKYGVTALAKELVGVSDNLSRALEHAGAVADEKTKQLMTGIEGVERQLQSAFERAGIKKMEPLDQPFDPNFHRVMLEAENTGKAPGTVTQVLQAGYVIHDRLLREALVAIAKGQGGDKGAANSAINQQA